MKKSLYTALAFAPVFALAQGTNLSGLSSLITSLGGIIKQIIPLIFAVAVIYFFWGLIQFLKAAGDSKAHEAGRNHMIYGIIAIAVMVSVYGLISWLQSTLGISTVTSLPLPTVPGL